MLSCKGNVIWKKGLKNSLSSFLPGFTAYFSSAGRTEGRCLNHQIQELNQELESVFGSSGEDEKTSPFSSSTSSCTSSSLNSREHLAHGALGAQRPVLSREPLNSSTSGLSHVDAHGKASMVNVSEKFSSKRVAVASGKVLLGPTAFSLVSSNQISKGDVLTVAKIAGICGAKQTGGLIPLCHNISLSNVQVNLELDEQESSVIIKAEVTAVGVTGVEMEALTAVSVAALTIYDMCKAVSKHITISDIQLESKMGGKSGNWLRSQDSV
eukprot:c25290_g1_i1 orf=240-1043(+)